MASSQPILAKLYQTHQNCQCSIYLKKYKAQQFYSLNHKCLILRIFLRKIRCETIYSKIELHIYAIYWFNRGNET